MSPKAVPSDRDHALNSHRYTHPITKERLISVTSVVGNWDDGDKLGAGAGAAVKLTKAGINYREEWNAKRDTGSRIHAHAASWATGSAIDILPEDEPYLDAFEAFCKAKRPEWLLSELAVASNLGYGGRGDLIGYWDGLYHLLDLKSGRVYLRELALQEAGYASADGLIDYDAEGMAVGLLPMPHIDVWDGLYLGGDGHATLIEVPNILLGQTRRDAQALAIAAFRSLLSVRLWAETQPKEKS